MAESAYFNGYDAVELTVPSGATIRCRPLSLKESARFHRLLEKIADGHQDSVWEMLEEFPKAVNAEEGFEQHVHPGELLVVVGSFFGALFSQRRNGEKGEKTEDSPSAPTSTD